MAARIVARYIEHLGYGTPRGWEHRKEKDEEVERNIEALDPSLKALWRKLRNQFKGSPQRRFEQFLEYVHDHSDEGMELLQENADRELKKMIKDLERRHWEPITDEAPPPASRGWARGDDYDIPFSG